MNKTQSKMPVFVPRFAAAVLWLATLYFGLAAIIDLMDISRTIYALMGTSYYTGVLVGQATAILGGILWLLMIVITGEYHLKYPGGRKPLTVSLIVLAVEFAILGLGMGLGT